MIKTIKKLLTSLSLMVALAMPMVPAVATAADDISGNLCKGANLDVTSLGTTAGTGTCVADGSAAATRVNKIIKLVIDVFSLVVGVVSVIMIIIGGLKYITSGGDSGNITSAKNTILYALIGLVVVALAQVVVKFVLGRATA
jgi:cytochrome bd-type quinol oxidase subunit 2